MRKATSGFRIPDGAKEAIDQAEKQGWQMKSHSTRAWMLSPDGKTVLIPVTAKGDLNSFKNALRRAGAVIDGQGAAKRAPRDLLEKYVREHGGTTVDVAEAAKELGLPRKVVQTTLDAINLENFDRAATTVLEMQRTTDVLQEVVDRSVSTIPRRVAVDAILALREVQKEVREVADQAKADMVKAQAEKQSAINFLEEAKAREEQATHDLRRAQQMTGDYEARIADLTRQLEERPAASGNEVLVTLVDTLARGFRAMANAISTEVE